MSGRPRNQNRYRAIPAHANAPADVQAMREVLEVLTGARGDALYRALTVADLTELGLLQQAGGATILVPGGDPTIPPSNPGGGVPPIDQPTQPTGFDATGTFSAVALYWDTPTYYGHAYTEILRSQTDNLATATVIATVVGRYFRDPVDPGSTYYYWIRFVNVNGDRGPAHAQGGFRADTAIPVSDIMESMNDLLTRSDLASSLQEEIDVGVAVETFLEENWSLESAVDAGGNVRISGMKLINGIGELSKLIFNTDVFTIAPPYTPGQDEPGEPVFIIGPWTDPNSPDPNNPDVIQRVVMANTVIGDLTVGDAAIEEIRTDKLTVAGIPGDPSSIAEVIIGVGDIQNAMIGDYIQSSDWNPGLKRGWKIGRGGVEGTQIEAYGAALVIRDNAGNIILDAGGGSYGQAISNAFQEYTDVNGRPASLGDINAGEGDKLDGVQDGATANRVFQQSVEPNPFSQGPFSDNDFWYDGSTQELYKWNSVAGWQLTSDSTLQHFQNVGLINSVNVGTYIASAAFDTIVLANEVLVVPVAGASGGGSLGPNSSLPLAQATVTVPNIGQGSCAFMISWAVQVVGQNADAKDYNIVVRRVGVGTNVFSTSTASRDDFCSGLTVDYRTPGTHTYQIRVSRGPGSGNVQVLASQILLTAVKR